MVSGIVIVQSGLPFSVNDSLAGSAFLGPGYTDHTDSESGSRSDDWKRIYVRRNSSTAEWIPRPGELWYPDRCLYPAQCQVDPNYCTNQFRGPRT